MAFSLFSKKLGKCKVVFIVMGIAFSLLGIISAILRIPQNIVDANFRKHLITSIDSPTFDDWVAPPTPVYMNYYIFNVTNPQQVIKGSKARVEQKGPYSYAMTLNRFDISFYANDTVSSRLNHTLHFCPERSNGSESDLLFHLNMPLVTVAVMIENLSLSEEFSKILAEVVETIGETDLFVEHTAKEILFGYVDPLFQFLSEVLKAFGLHYDPMFGPFYQFNHSDDGLYLTNTGKGDYAQTNRIERWNGDEQLSYWTSPYANMINGTDGSFFRPYVKRDENRYMYFSDVCRSLKLVYENDTSVKGVGTLRFHFADDIFANATIKPDNAGFCVPQGNCYDSGVLNVAMCRKGAPALLSAPHFYNAAPFYQKGVDGLTPNKADHDSVFDVEPISGMVFFSSRKIQINMEVKKCKYIQQMQTIQPAIYPTLWLGGDAVMNDHTSKQFRGIMVLVSFMNVVAYLMLISGLLSVFAAIAHHHWLARKEENAEYQPLLTNSNSCYEN